MRIKEIKQSIDSVSQGNTTIKNRLDFFKQKRKKVVQQVHQLNKILDFIVYKEWEYPRAFEAGTTSVIEDIIDDMLSDDLRNIRDIINTEREYLDQK